METLKVGIREFRSHLPHYLLEVGQPVAITRHGQTIGYYIPSREKDNAEDLTALKGAAARLDALLQAAQVDAEEIVSEFAVRRRQK